MTQFTLKLIALVAMLLDHTAKTVLQTGILVPYVGLQANSMILIGMMSVGRIAFPIFAWFLAEGCRKTSNASKHLLRLLLFAIISEIPFQLNFYHELRPGCHNVMFTMLLAAAAIHGGAWLGRKTNQNSISKLLMAIVAMILGWTLKTDYNAWGVGLILLLYYMPSFTGQWIALAAWITLFQLVWHGWSGSRFVWLTSSGYLLLIYWIVGLLSVALLAT